MDIDDEYCQLLQSWTMASQLQSQLEPICQQ